MVSSKCASSGKDAFGLPDNSAVEKRIEDWQPVIVAAQEDKATGHPGSLAK
jgi:hypothetical protein